MRAGDKRSRKMEEKGRKVNLMAKRGRFLSRKKKRNSRVRMKMWMMRKCEKVCASCSAKTRSLKVKRSRMKKGKV